MTDVYPKAADRSAVASAAAGDKCDADQSPGPDHSASHKVLGPWRVGERIAVGSMAEVFRAAPLDAEAAQADRYVLKRLHDRWCATPAALVQFRREAFVGRRVNHPHVVPVLAAQLDRPPFYLVMPRLEGTTLDACLSCRQPQSLAVSLWIARQLAQAANALHEAGWLHGDIKPANVFVSPTGHVTLLDLGSVRPIDADGEATACAAPAMGTPAYLAPEVLTSALAYSPQSDIYSLGVVLFELLSGTLPYGTDEVSELVRQHRRGSPPPVRRHAPHVPQDVGMLVERTLARDPLRRPASMRALLDQLTRLEIRHLSDRTPLGSSVSAAGERGGHRQRRIASRV